MADKIKAVIREPGRITAAVGGRDTTPAKWRGQWQPEERYGALHKVEHLGSSYVCIKGCVGVDPEADVTLGNGVEGNCWIMIAKRGDRGAAFTYADFTEAQLEALKGRPFTYADFTQEQLEALRGRAFTYDDFTEAQLEALRGRAFTYEDFTAEQLEALRGPAGETITDISRTAGTGAPGTIDTYTVTTSTGRTWPLYMYNGKDGDGAGDMTAAVYDPKGKKTDIFAYAEQLVQGLTTRLNALADSDDATLDQLSEIVAYIKSNKSLIDAITTAKVSVSDIVNDLVTNNASKPLSAAQGVALKALIEQAAASVGAHNQSAGTITEGTFAGQVVANAAAVADTSVAQLRNIFAGTTDLVDGVSSLAPGDIYVVI